jgi:uncharacterized protein YndB with AHSA1/START domain
MTAPASPAADQISLRIDASPQRIYDLVTDVAGMGRLSPECTGGRWLDDATGPAVGERFKGTNKRGFVRWSTTNTVVAAEPGVIFSFETKDSGTRWSYRLEADGDGTVVTESREAFGERPALARFFSKLLLGGVEAHDTEMREGMAATLGRLKDLAERPA